MNWDTEKLTDKLFELQSRTRKVTDPAQKYILDSDIYHLKSMLNHVAGVNLYTYNKSEKDFKILDQKSYDEMVSFLQKKASELTLKLHNINFIHRVPIKKTFSKRLDECEYQYLIMDFLSQFDIKLADLYSKLIKENRIQFGSNTLGGITCRGTCFPIVSDAQVYCYSQYRHRISNAANLIHELGHAYLFEGQKDVMVTQRILYSVLGEAYPIFLEYCFYDYLQTTRFNKEALIEYGSMIDSLFIYLEYNMNDLYNIPSAQYNEENCLAYQGFGQKSNIIELILSQMMAMHWFSMYKRDKASAMQEVDQFNESFGKESFEESFERIGVQGLYTGTIDVIQDYCRTYYKK